MASVWRNINNQPSYQRRGVSEISVKISMIEWRGEKKYQWRNGVSNGISVSNQSAAAMAMKRRWRQ